MELRYRHVEAALADLAHVKPSGMGAFRAKLRHLRNIGLPQLPNPGSGQPIAYSRHHALEMLLALELEKVGQTPRNAALLAQSIVRQAPYGRHDRKDCYVTLSKTVPGYTIVFGLTKLRKTLDKAPAIFLLINVSACVRKLDPALDRALATG